MFTEKFKSFFQQHLYIFENLVVLANSNLKKSKVGKYFPYTSGNFEIEHFSINSSQYWSGLSSLFWHLDKFNIENEVPFHGKEFADELINIELDDYDVLELEKTSNQLLDEAIALKEFFIPPNAFVDLELGPFIGTKIIEDGNDVILNWMTKDNKFVQVAVVPNSKAHEIKNFGFEEFYASLKKIVGTNQFSELLSKWRNFQNVLRLTSVIIIRDFWVVTKKEDVFYVQHRNTKNQNKSNNNNIYITYIPRRKYINKIDLNDLETKLKLSQRAKHNVKAHFRKGNPTPAQKQLAKILKIDLPEGHTYVKAHFRGGEEKERVYRSVSAIALASSIKKDGITEKNPKNTWFDFENEVYKIHKLMGYEVLFKASNYSGDGGIDLRVRKKTRNRVNEILIQCKYWKKSIGPDVVRELIGTLEDNYDENVNLTGAIYTISNFTPQATSLAIKHNIQLVDGLAWGKLSNSLTHKNHI